MECHLQRFVGEEEACPGEPCPYWESGRTGGRCGIETLALAPDDRAVIDYLLDLRARLMSGRARADDRLHADLSRRLGRDA